MADDFDISNLTGSKLDTYKTVAKRIKDTTGLIVADETVDGKVYGVGDVPEVGFKFIAKNNAKVSSALKAAKDLKNRDAFVDGDRSLILTGHFDICDVAAIASAGVAYREINYKSFAQLMDGPADYLPENREDKMAWRKLGNSFGRLHLNLSSLHFTVPTSKMDGNELAKCDAHIDHVGFLSDFGNGPGMTLDFPWHTVNELGVGVGGRAVFGNWFADHFRFVLPSSETKFVNEAGVSLQFRPSDSVTIELYATNKGVFQEKLMFVNADRMFSLPTNFGINIFGSF